MILSYLILHLSCNGLSDFSWPLIVLCLLVICMVAITISQLSVNCVSSGTMLYS